ncbi:MAG: ATP-dependent DNA helicase RecG [Sphaerobacter sp.]|nr:ATP-dependent DNA helicase RecG [Sphaerobacter sp.]
MSGRATRGPSDPLGLLSKILALEARKGYQDTAVTGGLAAFIAAHARAGRADGPLAELARLFADYHQLSPDQRRARVAQAERLLRGDIPAPAHPPVDGRAAARLSAATRRASTPPTPRRRPGGPVRVASLREPVTALPGVGEQRAKQLASLGVRTIEDLLYLVPRRHRDYSRIQPIGSSLFFRHECTVQGQIVSVEQERTRTGKTMVVAEVADGTGSIRAIWFNPYLARQLRPGMQIALSGRIEHQRGILCFRNPEWESLDEAMLHTGRLVPIYPLTRGLYQKQIRHLTRLALDATAGLIVDPLPEEMRQRHRLMPLAVALEQVHYPASPEDERAARQRLAFDEFLVLQIGLVQRKVEWQAQAGHAFRVDEELLSTFEARLPFRLTGAQSRALGEILADMARPRPASRLLQGDVGSGKTVVAAAAALVAVADGFQVAILAPTEILAEQHARNFTRLYEVLPEARRPRLALLTGSTPGRERETIATGLRSGALDILVGTHAILEEHVEFARLGLAVIDEQHRFGVLQRARLRAKGYNPDVLVMTATPIPRSLALVLHGDLDVSIIDELPPGRQAVATRWIESDRRPDAYRFIRKQVEAGRQAFIIYPLVEESEAIDARAATVEYERLATEVFPDLRLGLLHGRMRPAEKDAIMTAFRDHEIDILVSTSVVEVGIDVPNATVMLIEGADRFGLAQLHQFRGRVGRGAARSYCILVADDVSDEGQRRLEALVQTQDGFRLAEIDLELRGPGEFFGTRQSGLPDLRFASLGDLATLQQARDEAHRVLSADPSLSQPVHRALRERVDRFWVRGAGDLS